MCRFSIDEAEQKLKLIQNINDEIIKNLQTFYQQVIKQTKELGLIVISQPTNKKEEQFIQGILLHESVHQLLFYNNIKFATINQNLWKWDEGLCFYLVNWSEKKPLPIKRTKNKLLNIYTNYAKKWHRLFVKARSPEQKWRIINKQYQRLKIK